MLKRTATLLVIYAVITLPFSHPVFAQTQVPAQEGVKAETQATPASNVDFKKVVAENDKQYRERMAKGQWKSSGGKP